jgi:long-chain acyl-CoA synthetase
MSQDTLARPWYGDWPEGIPKSLETPRLGLGDLLRQTARQMPDNRAIVFLDTIVNYHQLDDMVDRFATGLAGLGIAKGDVAAIMLPNSHQFVVAYYACMRLGVIATAINPTYKPLEVKHQLNDSGAKALIVLDSVFESPAKVLAQTNVQHVIGTNVVDLCGFSFVKRFLGKALGKIPTGKMPPETIAFSKLLQSPAAPPPVEIDPFEDLAVLQYTGGTTGTPKGAMLTHSNLVSNALACKAWLGKLGQNMGAVGVLPLFHIFAMTCVMNVAVATGAFQLLFPKPPEDMKEWAAQIEKWGKDYGLIMPGVAALFNKINNTEGIDRYDISSLRQCLSAAGPLPREVQKVFEDNTSAIVVEGYGLSETSPVATANPFKMPGGKTRVMGSIGIPFIDTEIRVTDLETGQKQMPYGPDGVGEICVKGPQVMKGYYKQPEETAACLKDGWFHTGDVGYMDERGWSYILDRAKDLIKHRGYSVFPAEVEDYLYTHPDILEVAVIGVPHQKVGEVVKAFVVLKPEAAGKVSQEDIIAWCGENITHYKAPTVIEFRDELPKTLVGKVLRRVLRDEELKQMEGAA